jgi:hypothetical protein
MTVADLTTKYDFQVMHIVPNILKVAKVTQADWISYTKYKGVIPMFGLNMSLSNSSGVCAVEAPIYAKILINNTGTAYTATSTSIVTDAGPITRLAPYYCYTQGGEIIEVTADATPGTAVGTLTIRRGCLGTTASLTGLADNDVLYIMNMINLSAAGVGHTILMVYPLPNDPQVPLFKAQYYS